MNRQQQLQYCKKCTNRSFDSKKGIICNLTNEQATFEKTCPDYNEDNTAIKAKAIGEKIHDNSINKYPVLRYVIFLTKLIGWIIVVLTIIITGVMLSEMLDLPYFEIAVLLPVIYILFPGLTLGILLIATGEFLKVIVDIEKNTRTLNN